MFFSFVVHNCLILIIKTILGFIHRLTAFVVRSLAQGKATNLMYIDPHVIDKAVRFIVRQQEKEDGLMNNIGIVSHRGLQVSDCVNPNFYGQIV